MPRQGVCERGAAADVLAAGVAADTADHPGQPHHGQAEPHQSPKLQGPVRVPWIAGPACDGFRQKGNPFIAYRAPSSIDDLTHCFGSTRFSDGDKRNRMPRPEGGRYLTEHALQAIPAAHWQHRPRRYNRHGRQNPIPAEVSARSQENRRVRLSSGFSSPKTKTTFGYDLRMFLVQVLFRRIWSAAIYRRFYLPRCGSLFVEPVQRKAAPRRTKAAIYSRTPQ